MCPRCISWGRFSVGISSHQISLNSPHILGRRYPWFICSISFHVIRYFWLRSFSSTKVLRLSSCCSLQIEKLFLASRPCIRQRLPQEAPLGDHQRRPSPSHHLWKGNSYQSPNEKAWNATLSPRKLKIPQLEYACCIFWSLQNWIGIYRGIEVTLQ